MKLKSFFVITFALMAFAVRAEDSFTTEIIDFRTIVDASEKHIGARTIDDGGGNPLLVISNNTDSAMGHMAVGELKFLPTDTASITRYSTDTILLNGKVRVDQDLTVNGSFTAPSLLTSLYTKTNATTVSNTGTETEVLGNLDTGIGTTNLWISSVSDFPPTGSKWVVTGNGVISVAAGNTRTLTIKIIIGSASKSVTIAAAALPANVSDQSFEFFLPFTFIASDGNSIATVALNGKVSFQQTIPATSIHVLGFEPIDNGGSSFEVQSVDDGVNFNLPVSVTAQWSGATSGDSVTVSQASIIRLQ